MARYGRTRVLVVGGEGLLRKSLAEVLAAAGYTVEAATEAAGTFDRSGADRCALLAVDLGEGEAHGSAVGARNGADLVRDIGERWHQIAALVVGSDQVGHSMSQVWNAGETDVRGTRGAAGGGAIGRRARRLWLAAVKALSSALEAKDEYTRGHSERVSRLCGKMAVAMGMEAALARRLRLAARLHDIGKIGVPESVLRKPGPLSPEEWRQMEQHPLIGERILGPVLFDQDVLRIVRHHHERYAGDGYPDRLAGEDIPLGARVLAVADAFDALTSDRPYRSRLDTPRALETLRQGADRQWQGELVETLVGVVTRSAHAARSGATHPRR